MKIKTEDSKACEGETIYKYPIQMPALSKREYFASLAMQGFVSSNRQGSLKEFAESSVDMADQLIAELNKDQNHDQTTRPTSKRKRV